MKIIPLVLTSLKMHRNFRNDQFFVKKLNYFHDCMNFFPLVLCSLNMHKTLNNDQFFVEKTDSIKHCPAPIGTTFSTTFLHDGKM